MKDIVYSSRVSPDKALSYIFTIALNEIKKILKKKGRIKEIIKNPIITASSLGGLVENY